MSIKLIHTPGPVTAIVVAAGIALAGGATAAPAQRNNVLFIILDDLRPELGCYGERHMVTPNIDALAADGVLFRNAYVQYSVSAASRASFLTGCYPQTTGCRMPYSQYFVEQFVPSHATIQRHMYENGYYTRTLSKVHHDGYTDRWRIDKDDFTEPHYRSKVRSMYALDENRAAKGLDRPATECADVKDEVYLDGEVTQEAIATLSRATGSGSPFFVAVGLLKPHLPFCAPKKYWDLYDRASIPPCPAPDPTIGENRLSRSAYELRFYAGESDKDNHIISFQRAQELRHAYFACVSFVDAQVGKLVAHLKKEGLYDDTAIVLLGDHGWHLGDNGMWGKLANFERDMHAPLIIKAPKRMEIKPSAAAGLVEFVDVYPTICDLAGVPTPGFVEGVSLMPVLRNPSMKWKKAAFGQYHRSNTTPNGYTICDGRYRYVRWSDAQGVVLFEELYDHNVDPLEKENVAARNAAVCVRLNALMGAGWRASLPEGVVNRSDNIPAPLPADWGHNVNDLAAEAENDHKH